MRMCVYIYIYVYIGAHGPLQPEVARKGTNGVSTNGVAENLICFSIRSLVTTTESMIRYLGDRVRKRFHAVAWKPGAVHVMRERMEFGCGQMGSSLMGPLRK